MSLAFPHAGEAWTCTWAAPMQPAWGPELPFPTQLPVLQGPCRVHQTLRVGTGGHKLRAVFSNEYGLNALALGATRVVLGEGSARRSSQLTFAGQTSVTIAPGTRGISDELCWDVPPLALLELETDLQWPIEGIATFHWDARETTSVSCNDGLVNLQTSARLLLNSIEIAGTQAPSVVAVIGDSLVNGFGIAKDSFQSWVDLLAERVIEQNACILNLGQSGSRLAGKGLGVDATTRFARDALDLPGVSAVIIQAGLNDIGWPGTCMDPHSPVPSASTMIDAYQALIDQGHARGVKVIGTTLSPYQGAFAGTAFEAFWSPAKEQIRQHVNQWIRGSGQFDSVIDTDVLLRDPANQCFLNPALDSGDHLHPNGQGGRLIAYAVDTSLFLQQGTS